MFTKSALVQFLVTVAGPGVLRSAEMGITSAGMQDADCGGHMYTRTVRQIQQNTTVHYLVSPPRLLLTERTHKPKLKF
ncbi:hypothetical protein HV199_04365 [Citrobacter sp. RHBSTW-00446]|nr:hypothetical protein [Citrobacter sp. RHBSTW-00827]MBA7937150.1 hypothetical protein [Citrobacter sp. RHBSTW-00509]QLT52665.1 hypothetical protein HV285_04370 [Citrobacter sp. RHBSTW-00821]QLU28951.1 hypothetical protein HV199_04365 [Citrobacter sp. RHBSTW-00446]QMR49544.1 hypothetical protein HV296_07740 [Citrobacter sp. RHBSTW-00848]